MHIKVTVYRTLPKLLAFVPTLAGLGVVLILNADDIAPLEAFAIGLFGFIATLGITFYDQRNSELYNASINRASDLECEILFGCKYLFTWDNVPGDDSNRLLEYLKDYHDIDWAKSRDINKTADLKTINIVKGENSAKIKIDANEKVTLEINYGYLFSWNSVPGDDDEKFKESLRDDFDIGWAENAKILKSDDGKIIHIFKDENSAEIIIDKKKEKASLKISDGRTLDLKVKKENGKLNIYNDGKIRDLKVKKEDNKLKIYHKVGGIFNLRPKRSRTFFGILMWHDRALAMVYASALGAWLFIIISSILKLIPWLPGTFSLLLSVLLAIVIFKYLPKDAETSRGKSQGGESQGVESPGTEEL